MPKFRVVSDLHVEFYAHPAYLQRKLDTMYPVIEKDEILIVAGDLGVAGSGISWPCGLNLEYKSMLEYFARRWNYVILVPGNHEYYDRDRYCSLDDVDNMIRKECDKLGIVFLNKNSVVIDVGSKVPRTRGLKLIGCTLWSEATAEAYKGMNDKLRAILNHKELLKTHYEHKEWLDKELKRSKKKNEEVIVVTHHLPLQALTHPKYLTDKYKALNSAYASNLEDIILGSKDPEPSALGTKGLKPSEQSSKPSVVKQWFCGHTHERTETEIHGIKFLINPIGYPREHKLTKTSTEVLDL